MGEVTNPAHRLLTRGILTMTYSEYDRKLNKLFDQLITASREKRPSIEREIKRIEALAEKEGLS